MNKLIFHSQAEKELFESGLWYENQSVGLEARFLLTIKTIIEKIQASPEVYSYSKKPYREAAVPIFPYLIVYVHNKKKQTIFIAAVFHAHRNPKKKYRKFD